MSDTPAVPGERRKWRVRFEFKTQDCWFGVFWKRGGYQQTFGEWIEPALDIWICIVPMFPLHIATSKRRYL